MPSLTIIENTHFTHLVIDVIENTHFTFLVDEVIEYPIHQPGRRCRRGIWRFVANDSPEIVYISASKMDAQIPKKEPKRCTRGSDTEWYDMSVVDFAN